MPTAVPTPTPLPLPSLAPLVPGSVSGVLWTGTTSQGKSVWFAVDGRSIVALSIGYQASGCGGSDGQAVARPETGGMPVAIIGERFSAITVAPGGLGLFPVEGTFQGNRASGTLSMTLFSLAGSSGGLPCISTGQATWTAAPPL